MGEGVVRPRAPIPSQLLSGDCAMCLRMGLTMAAECSGMVMSSSGQFLEVAGSSAAR